MSVYTTFIELFGEGKELSPVQMSMRMVVVFFIALFLIRVSGRRTFGMRMPLDNVITILLGALLSRAVVGASPFWSVIMASVTIVVLYRIFSLLCVYSDFIGNIIKGKEEIIYEKEILNKKKMKSCMITEKDLKEQMRINGNVESFENIRSIVIERDGEISVVKEEK